MSAEIKAAAKPDQTEKVLERIGNMEKALTDLSTKTQSMAEKTFAKAADPTEEKRAGFKCHAHQLYVVRKAAMGEASDDDLKLLRNVPKAFEKAYGSDYWMKAPSGMSEAVGPDGGFLLAPQFAEGIMEIAHGFDSLSSRCDKVTMSGANLKMRAVDETSLASTRRGGVLGYWVDEGNTISASKPKFRMIDLSPHKIAVLMYATEELLADGAALEAKSSQYAAEELDFQLNDAILNGTGAGKPLGLLSANCLVSVSKETGQAAATVVSENIHKMWARLHSSCRDSAIWIMNQDVDPQLGQLNQAVGTGGQLVYMPPNGLADKPHSTLKGRPVIETPWNATLGTVGDLMLVDLKQYILATRGSIMASNSVHVQFLTDEVVYKWTFRVAGQPWWNSALTPFRGTNTQSPFIALSTRA